jgi:hypothetical protein
MAQGYSIFKKVKAILVTGCGGLYGCEMLRIQHFLDIWLIKMPGTHFC